MAISALMVWEARTTGASTNGGGYVSGGTDYSQQDSPQLSLTDIIIADSTTTTITSATGGFTSAMIGNIIYLTGGSGGTLATQRRQITAVTNTNTITVDQAPAPSAGMTGVTGNVGGALSGPWDVHSSTVGSDAFILGNTIYIKSGTYNTSSTWISKNAGSGTLTAPVNIVGYDTNRTLWNTDSNRPIINMTANSTTLFTQIGMAGTTYIRNIIFSSTAAVKSTGVTSATSASSSTWINCRFTSFTNAMTVAAISSTRLDPRVIFCEFDNCTGTAIYMGSAASTSFTFYNCYIHDNGGHGISTNSTSPALNLRYCLIVNNGVNGVYGYGANIILNLYCESSIIANNQNSQILNENASSTSTTTSTIRLMNCIIYGGQYCIRNTVSNNTATSSGISSPHKNAVGGASIANLSNMDSNSSYVILTEDPFVDSTNRDYRLNNKINGGMLCKNNGWIKNFIGLESLTNYKAIGPYQNPIITIIN